MDMTNRRAGTMKEATIKVETVQQIDDVENGEEEGRLGEFYAFGRSSLGITATFTFLRPKRHRRAARRGRRYPSEDPDAFFFPGGRGVRGGGVGGGLMNLS